MTTFIGKPVTLSGQQFQVGETAPDFKLITPSLEMKSLSDFKGKRLLVSFLLSIQEFVQRKHVHLIKNYLNLTILTLLLFQLIYRLHKQNGVEPKV